MAAPADGTRDGDGTWRGGQWYPDDDKAQRPDEILNTNFCPGRQLGETIGEYNSRMVAARLSAGMSHEDAYRDLLPADIDMRGRCEICGATDGCSHTAASIMDDALMRTHHDAGSPEERYSRQMRFDKYQAMQRLLMSIGESSADTAKPHDWVQAARQILAGMVRPRGLEQRASERAERLEDLATAYRWVAQFEGAPGARTAELLFEALIDWEQKHVPQQVDPLLLGRSRRA